MILIALGANLAHPDLGPPPAAFDAALARMATAGVVTTGRSRLYRNPAVSDTPQPDYVNAAVLATGDMSPQAVLSVLIDAEYALGRVRSHRWGPRVLDLDLIAVNDWVLPSLDAWRQIAESDDADPRAPLILPHPRAHLRNFVLAPLADVAPDWRHPVLARTVSELHDSVVGAALPASDWPV